MQPGSQQLRDWMDRRGFNQRETADYLEFPEPYVSKLLSEDETPGLRRALVMERRVGIPVEAWVTDLDKLAHISAPRPSKRRIAKRITDAVAG